MSQAQCVRAQWPALWIVLREVKIWNIISVIIPLQFKWMQIYELLKLFLRPEVQFIFSINWLFTVSPYYWSHKYPLSIGLWFFMLSMFSLSYTINCSRKLVIQVMGLGGITRRIVGGIGPIMDNRFRCDPPAPVPTPTLSYGKLQQSSLLSCASPDTLVNWSQSSPSSWA